MTRSAGGADRTLLFLDGAVNLGLGLLLIASPGRLVRALGVPGFGDRFYPTILGGVLVGIALALFLASRRRQGGAPGLGLAGAVMINICGAGALAIWLVLASDAVSIRGRITLWGIAMVVLGIAAAEIASGRLKGRRRDRS